MNKLSLAGVKIDYDRPINNRAKLDTGKLCNYDCTFCYYKNRLHERDDLQMIKDRADYLKAYGITEVDLSGGESSIEPNWFKILEYCNDKFEHISCLSHGGKFADIEFLKKSKEYGLKEILFSLHGWDEKSHETITQRKGSYKKILQAINNANELDMIVRINCTVSSPLPEEYAYSVTPLIPSQINFITLNYWEDNKHHEKIDYHQLTTSIKRNIDVIVTSFDGNSCPEINVRYTPICYMKGYEKYVKGQYQHIYDMRDWNKPVYKGDLDTSLSYTHKEKVEQAYRIAGEERLNTYKKPKACVDCKYFYVCDGLEKQLGDIPVFPESGEKITCIS